GSGANVSVVAPLASTGGSGPILSLPGVRIDIDIFSHLNTAVGGYALQNSTGLVNTAVGFEALFSNTDGSYNTAIGEGALLSNTSGIVNTATGWHALRANTTGQHN